MNCPLCRHGHATATMDACASFPSAHKWVLAAEKEILGVTADESPPSTVLVASITLFDGEGGEPVHTLEVPLRSMQGMGEILQLALENITEAFIDYQMHQDSLRFTTAQVELTSRHRP